MSNGGAPYLGESREPLVFDGGPSVSWQDVCMHVCFDVGIMEKTIYIITLEGVEASYMQTVLSEQLDSKSGCLFGVHGDVSSARHSARMRPGCCRVRYRQASIDMSHTAMHPASPPSAL